MVISNSCKWLGYMKNICAENLSYISIICFLIDWNTLQFLWRNLFINYIFRLRAHWKYHKTVQNLKICTEKQCLPRIQITFQRDFLKEKSCRCCQCCQCCLCCHYCHCCHCYLCIFRIPQSIFTSSLMTVVDYTQSWSNLFSLKRWRNVDCWLGEKTKEVKTLRNAKVLTLS